MTGRIIRITGPVVEADRMRGGRSCMRWFVWGGRPP